MALDSFRSEDTGRSGHSSSIPSPNLVEPSRVEEFIDEAKEGQVESIELDELEALEDDYLSIYDLNKADIDKRIDYFVNYIERSRSYNQGAINRLTSGIRKFHVYCDEKDVNMLDAPIEESTEIQSFNDWLLSEKDFSLHTIDNYTGAANRFLRFLHDVNDSEYDSDIFEGPTKASEEKVVQAVIEIIKEKFEDVEIITEHNTENIRNSGSGGKVDVFIADKNIAFECKGENNSLIDTRGLGQALDYAYHGHISFLAVPDNAFRNESELQELTEKIRALPIGLIIVDIESSEYTLSVKPLANEDINEWIDNDS